MWTGTRRYPKVIGELKKTGELGRPVPLPPRAVT